MQVLIDDFPKDNIKRYVAAVGAVSKSQNPHGLVILKPLLYKESNNVSVHKITIPELDTVRQGSIWEGQKQTGDNYDFRQKVVVEGFDIDLSNAEQRIETLGHLLNRVGTKYFNLPFNEYVEVKQDKDGEVKKKPRYNRFWFNDAKYNVIKFGKTEVIVSGLEVLTATYLPTRKDLRRMILSTPNWRDLLHRYLDLDKCSYNAKTNECILYPKIPVGDASFIFLAHLYSSTSVQKVYENIHTSYENATCDSAGRPYPIRYPEIKPYHTDRLKFSASGIWLDDEKKYFFVLRIDECYAPDSLKVRVIDEATKQISNPVDKEPKDDSPKEPCIRTVTSPKKLIINTKRNPSKGKRGAYMISEIQSHVDQNIIVRQTNIVFIPTDDDDDARTEDTFVERPQLEEIQTSSGDKVTNPKGLIRELRTVDSKSSKIEQMLVVANVISGLNILLADAEYGLSNLYFLDETASTRDSGHRISLLPYKGENDKWVVKEDKTRHAYLMQLVLSGASNFYYIIEIERIAGNEHFKGLTIESTQRISAVQIRSILDYIVTNEGKLVDLSSLNTSQNGKTFLAVTSFKHNKGGLTWEGKLEGVIAERFSYIRKEKQ